MLRRSGVKRWVWELHRDATMIVLKVIAGNKGVWHADPGGDVLYIPRAGKFGSTQTGSLGRRKRKAPGVNAWQNTASIQRVLRASIRFTLRKQKRKDAQKQRSMKSSSG